MNDHMQMSLKPFMTKYFWHIVVVWIAMVLVSLWIYQYQDVDWRKRKAKRKNLETVDLRMIDYEIVNGYLIEIGNE